MYNAFTYMGVSKNNGTPKSSILIGFSIINHPFWGTPIFGNTHMTSIIGEVEITFMSAGDRLLFLPQSWKWKMFMFER